MENRKEVYFDNSATTRVFDSVRDVMVEAMTSDYGNTSSRHMKGVEAERYIRAVSYTHLGGRIRGLQGVSVGGKPLDAFLGFFPVAHFRIQLRVGQLPDGLEILL